MNTCGMLEKQPGRVFNLREVISRTSYCPEFSNGYSKVKWKGRKEAVYFFRWRKIRKKCMAQPHKRFNTLKIAPPCAALISDL